MTKEREPLNPYVQIYIHIYIYPPLEGIALGNER